MIAMSTRNRGPVHISIVAAEALADLWERTCEHRRKTGQPLPPEHLNPNRKAPR